MKIKILILATIASVLVSWDLSWHMSRSRIYAETGVIINVTETEFGIYKVEFKTANGNKFSFYTDDFDIYEEELISVLMDDNGTEYVNDDKYIKHRYSGTPEMYMGEYDNE